MKDIPVYNGDLILGQLANVLCCQIVLFQVTYLKRTVSCMENSTSCRDVKAVRVRKNRAN